MDEPKSASCVRPLRYDWPCLVSAATNLPPRAGGAGAETQQLPPQDGCAGGLFRHASHVHAWGLSLRCWALLLASWRKAAPQGTGTALKWHMQLAQRCWSQAQLNCSPLAHPTRSAPLTFLHAGLPPAVLRQQVCAQQAQRGRRLRGPQDRWPGGPPPLARVLWAQQRLRARGLQSSRTRDAV